MIAVLSPIAQESRADLASSTELSRNSLLLPPHGIDDIENSLEKPGFCFMTTKNMIAINENENKVQQQMQMIGES